MNIAPVKRSFLCSLILILLFTSVPAWAGEMGVVNGSVLNIRKGPATSYSIVNKASKGQELEIIDKSGDWLKVNYKSTMGWVFAQYVTIKKTTTATKNYLQITVNVANIRKGPGTNYAVLTKIGLNEKHKILDYSTGWYKIQVGSAQGWISDKLGKPVVAPATSTGSGQASPSGGTPSRSGTGSEILMAPITVGKTLKVIDRGDRPEFALIGWSKNDYTISQGDAGKTLKIVFNGSTALNYQGQLKQLGVNQLAINQQNGKATVEAAFQYPVVISTAYDEAQKTTRITVTYKKSAGLQDKLIVIDPGHASVQPGGWLDPGAIGPRTGLQEKDVTLSVAMKVKALLEQEGARVIMTHTGSTVLSLAGRAAVANDNGADIFVAIHANSSDRDQLSGHTTYFFAPTGDEILGGQRAARQRLATDVQKALVNIDGRNNMGVLEANFAVLRETRVPSILVETAFISDRQEEVLLGQDTYRQTLAQGIVNGIEAYFQ